MRTWAKELEAHTHDYVRRGGKQNRKKQVSLIIDFLEYTDSTENLSSLHRLGKRQVVNFWKSHRHLSDKVAYDYWLGLCKLWAWLDKPDKPPKPNNFKENNVAEQASTGIANGFFSELSVAVTSARESHLYTVQQLANLSGLEAESIEHLEAGETNIPLADVLCLLAVLNIQFTVQKTV